MIDYFQVKILQHIRLKSSITKGVIEDITIDGVYCENGYTGVRLLSCGTPLRNVKISNVCGTYRYYAVSFTHHYELKENTEVMIENICVSGLRVSKSKCEEWSSLDGPLIWFEKDINCRNIVIENIFRHEVNPNTKAPLVKVSENVDITNLSVRNLFQFFEHENKCPAFVAYSKLENSFLDDTCK